MTYALLLLLPLAYAFVLGYALFAFYLMYCTLRRARDNGQLAKLWLPLWLAAWSLLGIGIFIDGLFNVTVGALMFWEWPELNRLMFTARCAKWHEDTAGGWRYRLATTICESGLNLLEPGHC